MLTKVAAAKFIQACMRARTTAHLLHLQTKSYARHMALGGFYETIIEQTDSFAETYMGMYGVLESYPNETVPPLPTDPVAFIEAFAKELATVRKQVEGAPVLANIVDDMLTTTYTTRYKLVTLK